MEDGVSSEVTGVEGTVSNMELPATESTEINFADIVPEDYKDKPWVQDVKDINGLFKMTTDLKSKLGERPAGIPQDDATDEQKAAFNKAFGVPESADGYELPEPKEGAEEFQKGVKQMFHEAGVSQKQAAKLSESFDKLMESMAPDQEAQEAEFEKLSLEAFGQRKEVALQNARALLKENAPESFKDHINNLDNKNLVILASVLDNIQQKYINEDSLPNASGSTGGPASAEAARKRGLELMASDAYRNAFHPDHAQTVEEVRRLYGT